MSQDADPFRHHPGLRDRIADPETSYWRSFCPAQLDAEVMANGAPADWRYGDAQIAAALDGFLAGFRADHGAADLWVFAYGSLMWDPGFRFAEVRRGRAAGHARSFCLRDDLGGRGTPHAPGLMAALAAGPGCEGLVFRLPAEGLAREAAILWRREMIAPAYLPVMVAVQTAQGPVRALTFAADPGAAMIRTDLTRAERVQLLATGRGVLGTSLQYIETLAAQLDALGIEDAELTGLLAEARVAAAAR